MEHNNMPAEADDDLEDQLQAHDPDAPDEQGRMSPRPKQKKHSNLDAQQVRYLLTPPKGGDGDPPYARDISLARGKIRSVLQDANGKFRYRRPGD